MAIVIPGTPFTIPTQQLNLFTPTQQGFVPASGGGTTNFLRADGTWVMPPGGGGGGVTVNGVTNIASLVTLVADGLTDNEPALQSFTGHNSPFVPDPFGNAGYAKTAGPLSLPTVVTLTIGSPGVVNWTNHGLHVNDAVVFKTSAGGALPTGLVAGTFYYVMFAGITQNSFQVSATNAFIAETGDGPAVNFTGSQSGTIYAQTSGTEWQTYMIPPGPYHCNGNISLIGDVHKFRLFAYGASFDELNPEAVKFGIFNSNGGYAIDSSPSYPLGYLVGAPITSIFGGNPTLGVGTSQVKTLVAADAAMFWAGGWAIVGGLDMQNTLGSQNSYPPNLYYFDFVQIQSISGNTITFGGGNVTGGTRFGYSPNYPTLFSGTTGGFPQGFTPFCGPATLYPLSAIWDCEVEIYGIHITANIQPLTQVKSVKYVGCQWGTNNFSNAGGGSAPLPSVIKNYVMEDCVLPYQGDIEIDKLIDQIRYINCDFNYGGISLSSPCVNYLVVDTCRNIGHISGGARFSHLKDSTIDALTVGPDGSGTCETLLIENCRIRVFQESVMFLFRADIAAYPNLLVNWTFSNGSFTQPYLNTNPNAPTTGFSNATSWLVPGRFGFVNDYVGTFDSMGSPFTVLDVYSKYASQATVTISNASPAVVTWTAHGLAAGTAVVFNSTTSGPNCVPSPLTTFTPYFVTNDAGLLTNSFHISDTLAHALAGTGQIATTTNATGTLTGYSTPQVAFDTDLVSAPVGNQTQSTVTITIASPGVVTWTAHGLTANTVVVFLTTGVLPTGISSYGPHYYVVGSSITANTFQVSATSGGTAINTSGSQSGTHTAVANPIKFNIIACPRITVIGSSGCPQIVDHCNGPQNVPLYSYAQRRYAGYPSLVNGLDSPTMALRGYLVSLTIEVVTPYTGGGGTQLYVISAPAFNTSLIESDLSISINANIAGIRVITPTGATGAQPGDVGVAPFGNWISCGATGVFSVTQSGPINGAISAQPVVIITVYTNQIPVSVMQAGSSISQHGDQLFDTTSFHGYL